MSQNAWIVDDDPVYQNLISSFLHEIGYKTRTFSSGNECLNKLSEKPDFIILDHNLGPECNGLDILRNIKSDAPDIPVIYLSGQDKLSMVSDAYKFGSVEYIEKDSASLLKLKLRIEKIEKTKRSNLIQSKKKKITIGVIIILTALTLLSLIVRNLFF